MIYLHSIYRLMTVIMKMRMKGKTRGITVRNQLKKLRMERIIKAKIKCSRQGVVVVLIMRKEEGKIKIRIEIMVVVGKRGIWREIMIVLVIGGIQAVTVLIMIKREGRVNQTHTQEQDRQTNNQLSGLVLKIIEQQEEQENRKTV